MKLYAIDPLITEIIVLLITEIVVANPIKFVKDITFPHDEALPHYFKQVKNYSDKDFPGRLIDRRGHMKMTDRLPGLTPLGIFYDVN